MNSPTSAETLKKHLKEETAPMSWSDLIPFFARGQLIAVGPKLDLLDVAVAVSQDNLAQVEKWMQGGDVLRVDDTLAKEWNDKEPQLLTVVIAPWVLAQEIVEATH